MHNTVPYSRSIKVILSFFVSVALMAVIYMLSDQNGVESGSLSDSIARYIAPFLYGDFSNMAPHEQQGILDTLADPIRKCAHASEYAMLAISYFITCWQVYAMKCEMKPSSRSLQQKIIIVAVLSLGLAFAYACTDELHQLFVDDRAGLFTDVLIDTSGALIGVLLSSSISFKVLK